MTTSNDGNEAPKAAPPGVDFSALFQDQAFFRSDMQLVQRALRGWEIPEEAHTYICKCLVLIASNRTGKKDSQGNPVMAGHAVRDRLRAMETLVGYAKFNAGRLKLMQEFGILGDGGGPPVKVMRSPLKGPPPPLPAPAAGAPVAPDGETGEKVTHD